jgi:hypothetical protein
MEISADRAKQLIGILKIFVVRRSAEMSTGLPPKMNLRGGEKKKV